MFDLEKAIKQWRKTLIKNEAIEDGYLAEIESHLRDEFEHNSKKGIPEEEAFQKSFEKIGHINSIGAEYFKTDTRNLSGRPPWNPSRWMPILVFNYIKIAFRRIRRHKGHSFINIAGLAVESDLSHQHRRHIRRKNFPACRLSSPPRSIHGR